MRFRARSLQTGSQVQFFVGGVYTGTHPSSISEPIYALEADSDGFVTLTTDWQEFHIDLQNADLTHVLEWQGYSFPLADFGTADLGNLYVMIEFVFGNAAADICFRNVMYLP